MAFLRMVGIPYEFVPASDHRMVDAPKGKVPWVWHKDINGGQPMGDSQFIIDEIVANPAFPVLDLDARLSQESRAIGTAVRCMLEESLYFGTFVDSQQILYLCVHVCVVVVCVCVCE